MRPPSVASLPVGLVVSLVVSVLASLLATTPAAAQRVEHGQSGVIVTRSDPARRVTRPTGTRWWFVASSAALPGTGQALLKQDRFVAYLAVEAFSWLQYATDLRQGRRERRAYRDLALRVARSPFAGSVPTGNFEYYETMERYVESGSYDATPGGAVDPETDVSTFNGSIWLLARQTFWADLGTPPPPGSAPYDSALAFYRRRAVKDAFRWSWRDALVEQDVFRRTISRSNSAFRQSVNDLGVVIANHVLSTVDAYVSIRVAGPRSAVASFSF